MSGEACLLWAGGKPLKGHMEEWVSRMSLPWTLMYFLKSLELYGLLFTNTNSVSLIHMEYTGKQGLSPLFFHLLWSKESVQHSSISRLKDLFSLTTLRLFIPPQWKSRCFQEWVSISNWGLCVWLSALGLHFAGPVDKLSVNQSHSVPFFVFFSFYLPIKPCTHPNIHTHRTHPKSSATWRYCLLRLLCGQLQINSCLWLKPARFECL